MVARGKHINAGTAKAMEQRSAEVVKGRAQPGKRLLFRLQE